MEERRWFLGDETGGTGPLLGEVGVLAELRVVACFFEAGDALNPVDCAGIKNVVVADPEFEGKTGTDGNEMMESGVVANGPRQTTKKNQREGAGGNAPGELNEVTGAEGRPDHKKKQGDTEGRVGEGREGPEQSLGQARVR